jgi:tetratricopeptide (TPR) repeat protein
MKQKPPQMAPEAGSVSELSYEESSSPPLEVTREDHLQQITASQPQPHPHKGVIARQLSSLMMKSRRKNSPRLPPRTSNVRRDAVSVNSDNDNAVNSISGIQSLNYTVASHDTVKHSNTTAKPEQHGSSKKTGGHWSTIKRIMGVSKTAPIGDLTKSYSNETQQKRQNTATKAQTKRVRSLPSVPNTNNNRMLQKLDHSIRCRMDGVDILALGGVQTLCKALHPNYPLLDHDNQTIPTFSGDSPLLSCAQIVARATRARSEIILDGFVPGENDRWTVRIEKQPFEQQQLRDGGSPSLPSRQLWNSLWGPEPGPHKTDFDENADDPVLVLAAECAVPIDVDEDTFIISNREHFQAINEIACVPLAKGNIGLALGILFKLLKGLESATELRFLKGTTLHNIGVLLLWQGEYERALSRLGCAVDERVQHLPKAHPDIVVSMVRKGMALFALERFDECVAVLEVAMPLVPRDHLVKAKIGNNLGVVYYHQKDFVSALKEFTKSLEIQRTWLEASVRREALVLDAATTLSNMGRVYVERGDFDLACHVYEEALLLQTTMCAKDTDVVLETLTNLALAKTKDGNMKKGLQILHGCVRSKNSRFGHGSKTAMDTIGIMGYLYVQQKQYPDAMKCLSTVRKWQKANLPVDNSSYQQTKELVDSIEDALGKEVTLWV